MPEPDELVNSGRSGKLDHRRIGTKVDAWILNHQSEAPALVWLERLSELLPGQGPTIDHHVVWPAGFIRLTPDEPPGDLIVTAGRGARDAP